MKDSRYIALISQPGSTPHDLFDDYQEELQDKYNQDGTDSLTLRREVRKREDGNAVIWQLLSLSRAPCFRWKFGSGHPCYAFEHSSFLYDNLTTNDSTYNMVPPPNLLLTNLSHPPFALKGCGCWYGFRSFDRSCPSSPFSWTCTVSCRENLIARFARTVLLPHPSRSGSHFL